uniref:Uncharacterized protein n=1 Tax=Romanomermis culicivorax TaxID=13658 RepID=A0A915J3E8_ROMCU
MFCREIHFGLESTTAILRETTDSDVQPNGNFHSVGKGKRSFSVSSSSSSSPTSSSSISLSKESEGGSMAVSLTVG